MIDVNLSQHHSFTPGLIALFGSGEMSPTGRTIHESLLKESGFKAPIRIGILEAPTGFEVNAIHAWPARMQEFFEKGLVNYRPHVARIRAWRKESEYSTNDPMIVDALLAQDVVYAGAGSPSYAVRALESSLAFRRLVEAHEAGAILILGSATAVAMSTYALPVYEIFKAGHDLFWMQGLDFFSRYGLNTAIIPHWNNHEGEDFDTTRCWMGEERFDILSKMLPKETVIIGIDEQTAAIFNPRERSITVRGTGSVFLQMSGKSRTVKIGEMFSFSELK